jgi:hypothetical protein
MERSMTAILVATTRICLPPLEVEWTLRSEVLAPSSSASPQILYSEEKSVESEE